MTYIYILQHIEDIINDEELNVKLLGFFSSLSKAEPAIEQYKKLPGFKDKQKVFTGDEYDVGFFIDRGVVNQAYWDGGYTTSENESVSNTIDIPEEISIPYWAKGELPKLNEKAETFASRLLIERYGILSGQEGPGSEYYQLRLYGASYE